MLLSLTSNIHIETSRVLKVTETSNEAVVTLWHEAGTVDVTVTGNSSAEVVDMIRKAEADGR